MIFKKKAFEYQRGILKTLLFFSPFFKNYKKAIVFLIILILINIATARSLPYIFGKSIDQIFETETPSQFWGVLFLLLCVTALFLSSFKSYLLPKISFKITADLRIGLVQKLLYKTKLSFFQKNAQGGLINRITEDVKNIGFLWEEGFVVLAVSVLEVIILIGLLFFLSWKLTALFLPVSLLMIVPIFKLQQKLRAANQMDKKAKADLSSITHTSIHGYMDIRILQQQPTITADFTKNNADYLKAKYKHVHSVGWIWSASEVFRSFPLIAVFVALIFYKQSFGLSSGNTVAYIIYLRYIFVPVQNIINLYSKFQDSLSSADRIIDIFKSNLEETKGRIYSKKQRDENTNKLNLSGQPIEFKDVSFQYDKDGPFALKNIYLKTPAKGLVSIIGRTGGGKSTLLKLITRLYEPQRGNIFIGEKNIKSLALDDLRLQVSSVEQSSHVFSGTLLENLTSFQNSSSQKKSVIQFMRRLDVVEFLKKHPLDKMILPEGKNLSLGERQFIALLRSLYKTPPLMLLDEATAFIDPETEQLLQKALKNYSLDHLCLVITHRLNTIHKCDYILAFNEGRIEYQGLWKNVKDSSHITRLLQAFDNLN